MEQLWNKISKSNRKGKNLYELLNASIQGVKRLFVLAYSIAAPVGDNPTDYTTGI